MRWCLIGLHDEVSIWRFVNNKSICVTLQCYRRYLG